jgi:hypothetical protein
MMAKKVDFVMRLNLYAMGSNWDESRLHQTKYLCFSPKTEQDRNVNIQIIEPNTGISITFLMST